MFISKTLRLVKLKTRADINAKISVLAIYVEAIVYLLPYNLHDCTFKLLRGHTFTTSARQRWVGSKHYLNMWMDITNIIWIQLAFVHDLLMICAGESIANLS